MSTINAVGNGLSGATGTGNFVGSTSPTLVTPTIGAATFTSLEVASSTGSGIILDKNGNTLLYQNTTASAVNYIAFTNEATGTGPIISASGTDTNVVLTLNGKGNSGCSIQGTTAGGSAASGYVGQIITSGSSPTTTNAFGNATLGNILSISLTAGDWDIYANSVFYSQSGSITTNIGINTTSATLPSAGLIGYSTFSCLTQVTSTQFVATTLSISSTTTVYLVGEAFYSGITPSWTAQMVARRVR